MERFGAEQLLPAFILPFSHALFVPGVSASTTPTHRLHVFSSDTVMLWWVWWSVVVPTSIILQLNMVVSRERATTVLFFSVFYRWNWNCFDGGTWNIPPYWENNMWRVAHEAPTPIGSATRDLSCRMQMGCTNTWRAKRKFSPSGYVKTSFFSVPLFLGTCYKVVSTLLVSTQKLG